MMLSTNPHVVECSRATTAASISCMGPVAGGTMNMKSFLQQNRPLLKNAVIQLDEDSTDIGSAMSSDADMLPSSGHCSPSWSDEDASEQGKRQSRGSLKQKLQQRGAALLKLTKPKGNFRCTSLETIMGTPAGMSEHPPLFFPEEGAQTTECFATPGVQPSTPKPHGFKAPPGLCSPQRRRTKGQSLLATAPKLPSPRRNRKSKVPATHSVLSTAPEHLLSPSHVLPPSPTRRVRSAIIEEARRDGAPLKVQMSSETTIKVLDNLLDPTQPVKKRLIITDSPQDLPKLTPGMPAKKRVTPWLLEEPMCTQPAMPR